MSFDSIVSMLRADIAAVRRLVEGLLAEQRRSIDPLRNVARYEPYVFVITGRELGNGKYKGDVYDLYRGTADPAQGTTNRGVKLFKNAILEDLYVDNDLPTATVVYVWYRTFWKGTDDVTRLVFVGGGLAFGPCTP